MRAALLVAGLATFAFSSVSLAADGEVSVERGLHISIIGGCHDCHTANYNETAGMIDPETALKGTVVGWQGPWGTTYPSNLRLVAAERSEDEFAEYLKTFTARPPMPYYNVHEMEETDLRSLYLYITSLGEPGEPVPAALPPGVTPTTPYFVAAPPIMP